MRTYPKNAIAAKLMIGTMIAISGCNWGNQHGVLMNSSLTTPTGSTPSPSPTPTPTPSGGPVAQPQIYVAGIGSTLTGMGAFSTPTAKGTIRRLENVMGVSIHSGGFEGAVNQLLPNLSNTTDPTQFSGGDSNMLLAYAACAQTAPSAFGVNANLALTTAANQATLTTQLVSAGMQILDKYTASLASQGSASAQVNSALAAIVNQSIANGATTTIAFVTICTAANTAGTTLLGF